jgi:hypothetical protein
MSRPFAASVLVAGLLVTACSSAAAPTPQIIHVTPAPSEAASVPAASSGATPTPIVLDVTPAPSEAASVPAASLVQDGTLLGTFNLADMESLFGTTFTTAPVEGGRMRYVTDVGSVGFEFMVDPADATKGVIQASVSIDDISWSPTKAEAGAIEKWYAWVATHQPDAVDWMKVRRADYVKRDPWPDEVKVKDEFGAAHVAFYSIGQYDLDSGSFQPPFTTIGFYVEDGVKLPNQ